jgi:two-component system, response regulator
MSSFREIEILLVEDNASDAELTIRALKKTRVINNILHVTDGEEALDFIYCRGKFSNMKTSAKPKLVILDLKLPKVDGLEVLREMKSHPDMKKTPVVVLTSSRYEQDVIKSYELGVNSYIVKPVDFEKFTEAVQNLGMYWMLINEFPDTPAKELKND